MAQLTQGQQSLIYTISFEPLNKPRRGNVISPARRVLLQSTLYPFLAILAARAYTQRPDTRPA